MNETVSTSRPEPYEETVSSSENALAHNPANEDEYVWEEVEPDMESNPVDEILDERPQPEVDPKIDEQTEPSQTSDGFSVADSNNVKQVLRRRKPRKKE